MQEAFEEMNTQRAIYDKCAHMLGHLMTCPPRASGNKQKLATAVLVLGAAAP